MTVNHSDPTYHRRTFSADIEGPDAPEGAGTKNKQWGIMHIKMKMHYPFGFFRIYQLDTMHLDRSDSTQEEYPEMQFYVAKKVTTPPKGENSQCGIEYAYLQGDTGKKQHLSVKVNKIRAGDYYIVYKCNFA